MARRHTYSAPVPSTRGGALLLSQGTQTAIGEALGVHHHTVGRWVSGARLPPLDRLVQIRDRYGIPLEAWGEPAPERSET